MGLLRDTLWVVDSSARRVTTFGPERAGAAVYPALVEGMTVHPLAYLGHCAILAMAAAPADSGRIRLVRVEGGHAFPLATGIAPKSVMVAFGGTLDDGAIRMVHPFSNHTLFGLDVTHNRVIVLDRTQYDRYVIRWIDARDGTILSRRTHDVEPDRERDTAERLADWWWYRLGARMANVTEARFKEQFVRAIGSPRFCFRPQT